MWFLLLVSFHQVLKYETKNLANLTTVPKPDEALSYYVRDHIKFQPS